MHSSQLTAKHVRGVIRKERHSRRRDLLWQPVILSVTIGRECYGRQRVVCRWMGGRMDGWMPAGSTTQTASRLTSHHPAAEDGPATCLFHHNLSLLTPTVSQCPPVALPPPVLCAEQPYSHRRVRSESCQRLTAKTGPGLVLTAALAVSRLSSLPFRHPSSPVLHRFLARL